MSQLPAGLKPGDTVKIFRGVYFHYGVYIGDQGDGRGNFVHVAGDGGFVKPTGEVKRGNLVDVANGSSMNISNALDNTEKILSVPEIIKRALEAVGKDGAKYNVFEHNCEHFANWCRYDTKISTQGLMLHCASTSGQQMPMNPSRQVKQTEAYFREVKNSKFAGEKD
ncbi:hypothetical protein V1264_007454 [Littorina saxatilis]|uniref:LRAT domain-containing protein n=1 Tax=Littorina saxatilis TaxID=31220 RepID=A0AAN9AWF6_9CAEN